MHPQFIPDEQIMFIPEPRIHNPVEATLVELPSLCYLVRLRLVAFQDWNMPPASPTDDGHDGGDVDEDDGSGDSNFNRFHPRIDDGCGGPSRGPTPDDDYFSGRDSDDDGSVDSNYNRFHPGIDRCHGGRLPPSSPVTVAGGEEVTPSVVHAYGPTDEAGGRWSLAP